MSLRSLKVFVLALVGFLVFFSIVTTGSKEDKKSSEEEKWERLAEDRISHPAFSFVADDPLLPRVLLMGDSISIGYTVAVRELLKGQANVHRIPNNGGGTRRGLRDIQIWLGERKWDVIHFNFGLHDLGYGVQGAEVPIGEYKNNLNELVNIIKKTGAVLIWASTTPVPQKTNKIGIDSVENYNAVARKIMGKQGVAVNDLYRYIYPQFHRLQFPYDVHFTDQGSQYLAERVVAAILGALNKNSRDKKLK